MKFTKLFGAGCKELGMKVKTTKDGIEITPTEESMGQLIKLMGGIPQPQGEKGVIPLKPLGVPVEVARQDAGSPRNPGSLKK